MIFRGHPHKPSPLELLTFDAHGSTKGDYRDLLSPEARERLEALLDYRGRSDRPYRVTRRKENKEAPELLRRLGSERGEQLPDRFPFCWGAIDGVGLAPF